MAIQIEYYEGKHVLEAADADELHDAIEKFKADNPDIPLEAPYVVRVKGQEIENRVSQSIVNPDSVTWIRECAFFGCTDLQIVIIPAFVTNIGESAFSDCKNLKSIVVAEGNHKYDSRNNCNAIIETENNRLVVGCMSTIIPNSVTEISEGAFGGSTGLQSIVIPDSVTKIGDYAFWGCTDLQSIVIPNSVKEIGERAFSGCTGLTGSLTMPNVETIGATAFAKLVLSPEFLNLEKLGNKALGAGVVGEVRGLKIVPVPDAYMPAKTHILTVKKAAVLAPTQIKDMKIHEDAPGISGALMEIRWLFDAFVLDAKNKGVVVQKEK